VGGYAPTSFSWAPAFIRVPSPLRCDRCPT
jgi:hypothetical protein